MLSSFAYLSWTEKQQQDLDYGKDWWSAYFENPKNDSFDFFIENHSEIKNFHWEVYVEKNKTYESDAQLSKGEIKKFPITVSDIKDKRITIKISGNNEIREIYKIISQ